VAYAELNALPLTVELTHEALDEIFLDRGRPEVTPTQILETVARHYGLSTEILQGKGRSQNVAMPRQVAMYLMREETGSSLAEIGQHLGGRDHTTVLYGYEKMSQEVEVDAHLRREILGLIEELHAK
jgi:chromosomal replication initiator protein